jgi:purine-binding chemotaxis protein CheW
LEPKVQDGVTVARFSEAETEEVVQLIGFYTGEKFFGADILSVREILRDPQIKTDREAPDFIAGFVDHRGRLLPVVDLRDRLDPGHSPEAGLPAWLLITSLEETLIGYLVDSVARIMKIAPGAMLPAPELMLAGLRCQYIKGVCKTEFGLLMVADLTRLLEPGEVDALLKLKPV